MVKIPFPRPLLRLLMLGAALALITGACSSSLEIGPIRVAVPMGEYSLSPELFAGKDAVATTHEAYLCGMPSEAVVTGAFRLSSGLNLGNLVQLSRLELVRLDLRALYGDFSNITELAVFYLPADAQDTGALPVLLGQAASPGGFGPSVALQPLDDVDLLALIRENDASNSPDCPRALFQVTVQGAPVSETDFEIDLVVDAYARLGSR